jgi:hypothetical protein
MKLLSVLKVSSVLLIITAFISGPGSEQLPEASQKLHVKYSGLTKTLVNLLKTRSPENLVLGASEISMENFIDTDIASLFDCDSVINKYLSDAGEGATYEMLSYALKNTIQDRFKGEDGTLFVNVSSDTTSDGMFINFSVYRDRPVSIPIVLNASDTSFSTSFDTACTVKFESDIDLFINTRKVNSGPGKDGVQIRINKLQFELTSVTDEEEHTDDTDCQETEINDSSRYIPKPLKTIPFYLRGQEYTAAARCFSIYAISYWYLTPSDATDFVEDEGECYTLSYKQLEKGQFRWDNENLSSFSASLVMIPAGAQWDSLTFAEKSNEFSYVVDDLFNDSGLEQISLCCDYDVKEGVTARSKKTALPVSRRSR